MGVKESSVWVILNEVPRTDWGVGGQSLAELDGVSESTHGGAIWHDMALRLN